MKYRTTAIAFVAVVGANIWEGSTVPYLLPDDDPPAPNYLGGTASRQAHLLGSNLPMGSPYLLSEDRWR